HVIPLRVVERVERFPPELQFRSLTVEPGKGEILGNTHIPVVAARARESILSHITEHAGFVVSQELWNGDLRDSSRVEPCRRGAECGIVDHAFLYADFAQRIAHHGPTHAAGHTRETTRQT